MLSLVFLLRQALLVHFCDQLLDGEVGNQVLRFELLVGEWRRGVVLEPLLDGRSLVGDSVLRHDRVDEYLVGDRAQELFGDLVLEQLLDRFVLLLLLKEALVC